MGLRTELVLRLPNSPGAAAVVCQALADERVNISAVFLPASGHLHLVVDNPVRATGILREQHHQVAVREVLFVTLPHGPGALAGVLAAVRDAGVNIDYMYGSTGGRDETAAIVIGVDDAARAATLTGL